MRCFFSPARDWVHLPSSLSPSVGRPGVGCVGCGRPTGRGCPEGGSLCACHLPPIASNILHAVWLTPPPPSLLHPPKPKPNPCRGHNPKSSRPRRLRRYSCTTRDNSFRHISANSPSVLVTNSYLVSAMARIRKTRRLAPDSQSPDSDASSSLPSPLRLNLLASGRYPASGI